MHLDQVFGLVTGAVEHVVDMGGGGFVDIGDDEADVEAAVVAWMRAQTRRCAFQDFTLYRVSAYPRSTGFCSSARRMRISWAASRDAGQPCCLAIRRGSRAHCSSTLRPAIVAVAADQDAGGRSVGADAPDKSRRRCLRIPLPVGVLLGRRIMATGRPVAAS